MFPMFAWGNFGKICDDFNFQNYTGTFKKKGTFSVVENKHLFQLLKFIFN